MLLKFQNIPNETSNKVKIYSNTVVIAAPQTKLRLDKKSVIQISLGGNRKGESNK